jgi:ABC-type Fe3+/spermidine/putrescine transport system ATPase subunit
MEMMPEVELVEVSKNFGKVKAIDRLSLRVEDGEYFTLIGPTGHGKTTTLKLIAGLVKPDEGDIYIDGKRVTDLPPEERGIGFVFETFSLFPHYSVWRNTIYGPQVRDEDPESSSRIAEDLLEMVLLGGRREARPDELSGGMKQRVALARTLATGSKLLLLDEPFGSLDAKIRMTLRNEVRMMVEHLGLTAIHVTNDTEEAMTISDRMGVLRRGHLIQVDVPEELYRRPNSLFAAHFLGESNFFEGEVKKIGEDGSLIETEGGKLIGMSNSGDWRRGDRIVLAVRAENIEIVEREAGKANVIRGTVERSQFIHGFMRYEIQSELGRNVTVWTSATPGESIGIGSRVTMSFDPQAIFAFPYPQEGIEEAISFD